ncbi:AAA family ATPase [Legionella oakridgensis]|uniref:ATPase n=2 Tax=Legionella oakridgensis TaxID=29423 RepID=A0A0W0XJ15_9GAMM|nr:ATP-binding protein [Legionella oakridgensis]AHE68029.1 putative ATPase [Legionella oakridgensis ATCC 33761 = DSM 21215]ETO92458.1 putative ATPase [Legionella oakridgensis RV-2-2007]KTD44570.1 ATPase [Legionella oakridgensis]STY21019.1 ATPase [Legionella longbeachae]
MKLKTNWCVITGAPSSGKTTLINALSIKGYRTAPEIARAYLTYLLSIHSQDFILHRGNEAIQQKILELKTAREKQLPPDELIFFDRGVPDSLGYYRYYHLNTNEIIHKMSFYHYAHVFFLEGLPIIYDEIRREDEKAARDIGEAIYNAYTELEYEVIRIPPASVEQRLAMVLSTVASSSKT